ncbi:MAG: P-loop NTPase fold protein [Nanoarchaeota archaeon]|nr:P-loop NTPase fold protein [Nanoarchaeota archaeon]
MISVEKPIYSKSEDFLDRKGFSDNIANAILNYSDDTKSSLTIGLYGKWGSGKTSIVNMIIEKLENDNDTIVFKFEPWLFSDTQQLISSFFKEFAKAVKHKDYAEEAIKIGKELETYATFFEPMSLIPDPTISLLTSISSKVFSGIGKASKKWGQLKTKDLSQTKASIEKHLHKLDKKILIIIDDIDRLNNTEIRQIFQMIKVLGNFPNTIYLSSMDKEIVMDALSEVQKGDGSEYLEKIINVPFEVPPISKNKVEEFLKEKLKETIPYFLDENKFDNKYWNNIYYSGYKNFFGNIRDVTRYINVLKFNYLALENKVNVIDLIAITAFQVLEPKIYELIKNKKEYFAGSIHEEYENENKEKYRIELKSFLENSYSKLQKLSKDSYLNLLGVLFLKIQDLDKGNYVEELAKRNKKGKISSREYFDSYFTLTLSDTEISSYDMKQYIDKTVNEDEFRNIVNNLIKSKKIKKFLEKLTSYTKKEIPEDNFQIIFNVLIDLGDEFDIEDTTEFYITTLNWIFSSLMDRLQEEVKRHELIKKSIENANNSLSISCFIVSTFMQEHGEYENISSAGENYTINKEHLEELKNILKNKIERWISKKPLLNHQNGLSILYLWKRLDNEIVINYVKDNIQDDENLIKFLNLFISRSSHYTELDYVKHPSKDFNYNEIKNFIEPSEIIEKIEKKYSNIKENENSYNEKKFVLSSFINHYNSKLIEKKPS